MYAKKYWDVSCIDYKEYYQEVLKFLNKASDDSLTAEEFEEYNSNHIEPMELLASQEGDHCFLDLLSPQDCEQVKARCYEIYDDCYEDKKQELIEYCDFNFNED